MEVYVHASLSDVIRRDPEGSFHQTPQGKLAGLIGIAHNMPHQPPDDPELILSTKNDNPEYEPSSQGTTC